MWSADYAEYLQSPEWRAKRALIVQRANGQCERCQKPTRRFQVHHKTYVRQGEELLSDLEALCAQCHMKHHGIKPPKKAPKKKTGKRVGGYLPKLAGIPKEVKRAMRKERKRLRKLGIRVNKAWYDKRLKDYS